MLPILKMPREVAASVKAVFCDVDDTITTEGRLTGAAYQALEDLECAGIAVAPISGRPAGWCDMIARLWPVKGVVGENGAFYYSYDSTQRRMIRKLHPMVAEHVKRTNRFDRIKARMESEVPGAAISADQSFRLADLAIDHREDVDPLPMEEVARIERIFLEEGAVAKVSSIHVNGWFGEYDKLSTSRSFATDVLGLDIDAVNGQIIFVGDSPNDEPMFGFFENSCGVANVQAFASSLGSPPKWVADHEGGAGFAQIVRHILSSRN